ncbi:hypothetical protein Btru_004999 [Bulinus truncatus]|nr:hypothetical protein Btru_004999 [Bulinus truncatus]
MTSFSALMHAQLGYQLLNMNVLLSYLLIVISLLFSQSSGYVNNWDQPFDFKCPGHQVLSYISSVHSNYHEDRRWEFHCRTAGATGNCFSSAFVNWFDEMVVFRCPGETVLTGMASYHDNGAEDRRFRFHCCPVTGSPPRSCYMSGYVNNWDDKLTMRVPEGRAIKGHDNKKEDRRWMFEVCYI